MGLAANCGVKVADLRPWHYHDPFFQESPAVFDADLDSLEAWSNDRRSDREIAFRTARVLMQDFTGVPAVVDLAAMRDAAAKLGAHILNDRRLRLDEALEQGEEASGNLSAPGSGANVCGEYCANPARQQKWGNKHDCRSRQTCDRRSGCRARSGQCWQAWPRHSRSR